LVLQMSRIPEVERLTGKIGDVAQLTGLSSSTIRRRLKDDPDFPKAFRLTKHGDLMWWLAEFRPYLERKAGRQIAA
jgi:predicted DNA-binding transcriptional regulator AlpA